MRAFCSEATIFVLKASFNLYLLTLQLFSRSMAPDFTSSLKRFFEKEVEMKKLHAQMHKNRLDMLKAFEELRSK